MLSGPVFFFTGVVAESVLPPPSVPVTLMPSLFAAARSIEAFLGPVVRRSLRFGSFFKRAAGKGVRSRMEEMMTKDFRRVLVLILRRKVWMGGCREVRCRGKW